MVSLGKVRIFSRLLRTASPYDTLPPPIDPAKSESPTIDTLILALVVQAGGTINVDGGVLFSGSYTITGGTGRYTGATGNGVFGGLGFYLTETDGIGAFALAGGISFSPDK